MLYFNVQQLQTTIGQGVVSEEWQIIEVLNTLARLSPFTVIEDPDMGFTLIEEILGSSFSEESRYRMAGIVVPLLGNLRRRLGFLMWNPEKSAILLDFLLLSEKFYAETSPPFPESNTKIIPILSSTLLPTNHLRSRSLALMVFNTLSPELLSSQMEEITADNLENLLRAVGDPFLFNRDTLPDGLPTRSDYEPISTAVVLIQFASSSWWRNHLRHSNFTTFEEVLSTEEGKRAAFEQMNEAGRWQEFLPTAAKAVAAIERLEELQCLNTAAAVIMWAWTDSFFDSEDRDAWESIERTTLSFYRTRRIGRLKALERHITSNTTVSYKTSFLSHCILSGSLDPSNYHDIARACLRKRLQYLFGPDLTTGGKAVADQEEERKMDLSSVGTPVSFVDWACDYP
ncbi:hypothetical protein BJ322DRAFT_232772 [Thelephora terrestris]|uniref:Uncharacterized protein n=1 Tax=Thelephora terrestris TaxID=56493 RepID=A0A9P6H879_9AGAM|nr:hypothetical protein BJ322DRAFT_232772 [Thelephora terrestris]